MNRKKYFVALIALNSVLLALAASLDYQHRCETPSGSNDPKNSPLAGPSGKFGPVIETVLPFAKTEAAVDIMDLETGSVLRQPGLEYFNSRADALMAWIRSNGLDIACAPGPGCVACVTYDMTIFPVQGKCWQKITEQELRDNPALAPVSHSARRLLLMSKDRIGTYIFRTAEGTLGMLQLAGLSENGRGVKIRYKLINPTKSAVTLATARGS